MNTLRIPTREQYAYIEVEYDGTPEEAIKEYRRLTGLVHEIEDEYRKITTFTGEEVLYNENKHLYKTLDGIRLLSGSAYKKSLEKPFPKEIANIIAVKYGMPVEDVLEMWKTNSEISIGFGTALHKAMELYRKYRHHENEKNYFLAKNPMIREAVLAFPALDGTGHSEIVVSDIQNRRVGQIDWLEVSGDKSGVVEDYKSDADITKTVSGHFNQLSFYAEILKAHGWTIPRVRVWNFDGKKWTSYDSDVLEIKGE